MKSDLRTPALIYVSHWFKSKLSDRTYDRVYTANYTNSDGSYGFPYLNKSQLQIEPSTYKKSMCFELLMKTKTVKIVKVVSVINLF